MLSHRQADILPLKTYTRDGALCRFLVLEWADPKLPSQLFEALTPDLMHWDQHVWIFDLKFSRGFWVQQAQAMKCSPQDALKQVIDHHQRPYRALLCEHPWQAALLFAGSGEQSSESEQNIASEFISLESPYGHRLLERTRWEAWFLAIKTLSRHAEQQKFQRFRTKQINGPSLRLKRAMQRLGIAGPFALPIQSNEALRRRFGSDMAILWQWTMLAKESHQTAQSLPFDDESMLDFPWISLRKKPMPECRRFFDHLVLAWDDFKNDLRADLNKLCEDQGWSSVERVCELTWELTLFHGERVSLVICFRNPHSLHHERPEQITALTQTQLVYERFLQSHKSRDQNLELPDDIPILGWTLRVEKKMTLKSLTKMLFASDSIHSPELEQILSLENKLPLAFELYGLDSNFDPLLAYGRRAMMPELDEAELRLWSLAAARRPLFVYKEKQALEEKYCGKIFLERSCRSWWQPTSEISRDYYRILDRREHRSYWASYDTSKKWYKYGIYS